MAGERWFLDTAFVQALLNSRDQYHALARTFVPRLRTAAEIWVTEAVLLEIGNALSASNRSGAVQFIRQCYSTQNIRVITIDTPLLTRALDLYQARPDKTWGLIDCISFVVMDEQQLTEDIGSAVRWY
jgi:predicted nucleic acid-binding protein